MREHLLNWAIGSALLGAGSGWLPYQPWAGMAGDEVWRGLLILLLFVGGAIVYLSVIMTVLVRFTEGRFAWATVRTMALLLAFKVGLGLAVMVFGSVAYYVVGKLTGGLGGRLA